MFTNSYKISLRTKSVKKNTVHGFHILQTVFLFIFASNWAGALIPWKLIQLPEGELAAPTNDINVTVALALLTSLSYFYAGLSKKGIGYLSRYVSPTPILLPINILEDFTKPLSLKFPFIR